MRTRHLPFLALGLAAGLLLTPPGDAATPEPVPATS